MMYFCLAIFKKAIVKDIVQLRYSSESFLFYNNYKIKKK